MLDLRVSFIFAVAIMIFKRSVDRVSVIAPAKINFYLELLARREDGFHELETVMSGVSIYDHLLFERTGDTANRIAIKPATLCGNPVPISGMPTDESNLVYKALDLVRQTMEVRKTPVDGGINVSIHKRIPTQAGLGGASSDAAAALLAANELWKLGLSLKDLQHLGGELGSDVPFFLTGGLALCTGRGEQVKNLNYPVRVPLVIAKPPEGISTAEIYSRCRVADQPIQTKDILAGFETGNLRSIGRQLFNRLEQIATGISNWIDRLKWEFHRTECLGHQLTGSGSCYFGIFPTARSARLAANRLCSRMPDVKFYCCHTLGRQ